MENMKIKLKKKLDIKGYIYTDMGYSISVEFYDHSVIYNIYEDKYSVYIFNNENEIIAHRDYKQPLSAINYTLKF